MDGGMEAIRNGCEGKMRTRPYKPSFCKNETIAECNLWSRLLLPGLWMMADANGRMEYRPKKIRAEIFAFDDAAEVDIENRLVELDSKGLIHIYEVDGRKFIEIHNFKKHARPHPREETLDIPARPRKGSAEPRPDTAEPEKEIAKCAAFPFPLSPLLWEKAPAEPEKKTADPEPHPCEVPTECRSTADLAKVFLSRLKRGPNSQETPEAVADEFAMLVEDGWTIKAIESAIRSNTRRGETAWDFRKRIGKTKPPSKPGPDISDPVVRKRISDQEEERIRKGNE